MGISKRHIESEIMWKSNSTRIFYLPTTAIAILLNCTLIALSGASPGDLQHLDYPEDQFVIGQSAAKVNCSGGRNKIIYKESKVFIEIPDTFPAVNHINSWEQRRRTEELQNNCVILFRSPFQCPHAYAVQVIEDNPQKCHQNLQNCLLHQRVYWTRDGVLEVILDNRKTFATSTNYLLHVERFECAKSLKGNGTTRADFTDPHRFQSPGVPYISRLRVIINGDLGLLNMEEEMNKQDEETVPENKVNIGNRILPPTDHFPLPPPQFSAGQPYLIPQTPRTSNVYLISPGFPRNPAGNGDCAFIIPRVDIYSCRLRINLKFFNLPDPDERFCHYHYLQIDNNRICGCKSGLIYLTQWDYQPKVIRYVNKRAYPSRENVGFLLEVIQEQCPTRYESQRKADELRDTEPVTNSFYHKSATARFFHNQQCRFHFRDWHAVLGSPLWATRRQCRAMVPFPGSGPQYW